FLQRIEIIMAFMWITSIFIRTFMYFYTTVVGIAQIMKLKDHRPLILPMGIIMMGLSQIIHPDIVHSDNYNNEIWPIYSFIFTILLPILLLIVAVIRNRKSQGNSAEMGSANANQGQVTDVGGNTDVNQGNQPNPANTDSQQDNQMKPNNMDANQDNSTNDAVTDSNQDNYTKPDKMDANQNNQTHHATTDSNQDNQ
ncbi:GerAB/ArcD/ProY family transporter, partial [Lysinibacillus sphaericus]|uniref:GerAB/ArcD/ProY family transporter n=1 Tax=Lysinibacillus sphaericus TaxID=1421 RepID=UPI000A770CC0